MKDICLQVLVYGFILFQSIQKYSVKGQQLNYFLQRKKEKKKDTHAGSVYYSLSKLNSYYNSTFETPLRGVFHQGKLTDGSLCPQDLTISSIIKQVVCET